MIQSISGQVLVIITEDPTALLDELFAKGQITLDDIQTHNYIVKPLTSINSN